MQLETYSNCVLPERNSCCLGMLKLTERCCFEVNFTSDLCARGEGRWLLVLSPVGTEVSVAVEENRGEMLALELAVLTFLVVKQLVPSKGARLSVEPQSAQTSDCMRCKLVWWNGTCR